MMFDLGCMLVESRPFVVLDGLPGLYGLKYDSATACGLLLYLCSYKLDGSATITVLFRGVKLIVKCGYQSATSVLTHCICI